MRAAGTVDSRLIDAIRDMSHSGLLNVDICLIRHTNRV